MRRFVIALVVCLAGSTLALMPADALVNQPDKGKNFKINLMTAYEPCTVPNAMTDDGFDACTPPVRSNPTCGFDGGLGKVQLKALTVGNTDFRLKLNGLESACDGATLNFFISFRKTGVHCGIAECTMADVVGHPLGSCSVNNGICKANGQQFLPGGADPGQYQILEVYVEQNGARTFTSGLLTQRQ